MKIRFDDALRACLTLVRQARVNELRDVGRIVIVRDLMGRLRLAVENRPTTSLADLESRLRNATGPYHAPGILVGSEMLAPGALFDSFDGNEVDGIVVLERMVTGAEWTRPPLPNADPRPPRATVYGIKGGVGRSTAVCAWARHLARRGERVLVVDLDLESPGISSTLLPVDATPDFGIVDWLVEDGVDNADEDVVNQMVGRSPLSTGGPGEIFVAPCGGTVGDGYLAKLARAYVDVPKQTGGIRPFAERLAMLIDSLELTLMPSIVLLDSRAGLHDLAGIATTRLGAMTFLFAVASRQTWAGYRTLLRSWKQRPAVGREIRERLRIVAAQIPETGREQYLDGFITSAYDLFADSLYEEVGREHPDGFNFDVRAKDAPHFPLAIYWSRPLQDWDPLKSDVTEDQLQAALGSFLEGATDLVLDPQKDADAR